MKNKRILGMLPGESIPHTRHGEEGFLYRPVTQLTGEEMQLYGRAVMAGDDEPDTRDNFLKDLQQIADSTIDNETLRAKMVAHVTAYADELALAFDIGGNA